jgi:endonuclease/exonuclease/phosphatase family metal-dependent hydrolase
MTFTAADRRESNGRIARSRGSHSRNTSRWLAAQALLTALTLGLSLILWGCVSPESVQVRHAAEASGWSMRSQAHSDLRLVTYNIWGLPAWINGADSARYASIAAELESHAPHFILLQEVWSTSAHEAIPAGNEWSTASNSNQKLLFHRSGLVSLSRFPIVDTAFHAFQAGAWPDALVNKGALKITVELSPALRVNVWNVHLQAGSAARVRSRQIVELADWVRRAEDGQAADLIAGDFNCTPDSERYAQLTKLLGVDSSQLGSQPHFVTYDGCRSATTEARTLDYVFVRMREPQIACAATVAPALDTPRPEDRLSDHLAVQVDFRFELTTLMAQSPTYEMPIARGTPRF